MFLHKKAVRFYSTATTQSKDCIASHCRYFFSVSAPAFRCAFHPSGSRSIAAAPSGNRQDSEQL